MTYDFPKDWTSALGPQACVRQVKVVPYFGISSSAGLIESPRRELAGAPGRDLWGVLALDEVIHLLCP